MEQLTPKYALHLRELVHQAGQADPDCQVFGASKHRYRLNPVLSISDVSAYEAKYHVRLPSQYRFFITHVGNGGAGPDYGIAPLNLMRPYQGTMDPPFISSRLTLEQWDEKLQPVEDDDCPDDVFDAMEEALMQGVYELGSKGCTYENITVTNGEDENRVFYINFDWDAEQMPYDTGMDFLTWYESFFQEIIAGNQVSAYGYRILGTEQELISRFRASDDRALQSKVLYSFTRFKSISQETHSFFTKLSEEDFPRHKLSLLLQYVPQEGLALFERFLREKPLIAIAESRHVPTEVLPQFYEQMRHLLYTIENGSEHIDGLYSTAHTILMHRMADCPQMRTADMTSFLKKDGITEQEIEDAYYYMGMARDKGMS